MSLVIRSGWNPTLMSPLWVGGVVLLSASLVPTAGAQVADSCAPQDEDETISDYRLLRQLSLDLLGRIPTMEELAAMEGGMAADGPLLDQMLQSEEYFAQVRGVHRALLWGNLSSVDDLAGGTRRIGRVGATDIWRVGNNRNRYRGRNTLDCLDEPQPATAYDAEGRPTPLTVFADASCSDGECRQEGYVMVAPFWDPATPVKVCAYDAMAVATGLDGNACGIYNPDPGCGCGPNLRHCLPSVNSEAQTAIREGLEEEAARIFEMMVREGRSYLEAFTTRETLVNGPTAFYYRNHAGAETPYSGGTKLYDPAFGALPNLPFEAADDWRVVMRSESHAGSTDHAAV